MLSTIMTERDLKDPTGKVVFRAVEYDGTRFPAIIFGNIANQLRELNGMTFKESDVFVVAYPKSGTHWCYEIVAMLRNNSSELTKQSPPLIDRLPVEKLRQVSDGVRVSHLLPRHMPRDSIERRCKIIHIYRNPKDVAVSYFHFLKKTKEGELIKDMEFDVFFQMFITDQLHRGSWIDYVKEWTDFKEENVEYPLLNICYESMKKDLRGHVKIIADFLEVKPSEELMDEIAHKCEFQTMSAFKHNNIPDSMCRITEVRDKHIMYRKGEVGDWKNWLTVAQSEALDERIQARNLPLEIHYS